MRILFCNIAWMEYYNGISEEDKPKNGGSWIDENGEGGECWNFTSYEDGNYCGYVSTKSNKGISNQLRIENIEGINEKNDEAINVLVIWVAKDPYQNKNNIIGWYKNATVLRYYDFDSEGRPFNVIAKQEDCVLLPINKRHKIVPRAGRSGYTYGMGQSNVWYGKMDDEKSNKYVNNMIEYINSYNDENLSLDMMK